MTLDAHPAAVLADPSLPESPPAADAVPEAAPAPVAVATAVPSSNNNSVTKAGLYGRSLVLLGRYSYGFENVTVKQWNEGASLRIGAFCSIASDVVVFLGGNHRVDWITTFPFGHIFRDELGGTEITGHPGTNGDVVIGDDVWIGHGVTIMSGISIGTGAVIAANTHVVKDVPPYGIVGGNPGRLLKRRFDDETIGLLLQLKWWDLPLETIRDIIPQLSAAPDAGLLRELIGTHRPDPGRAAEAPVQVLPG